MTVPYIPIRVRVLLSKTLLMKIFSLIRLSGEDGMFFLVFVTGIELGGWHRAGWPDPIRPTN